MSETLEVVTFPKMKKPQHPGFSRRMIARASAMPSGMIDAVETLGLTLQKVANTFRFESFWREKVHGDARTVVVPTFNKTIGKRPIWNLAINLLNGQAAPGTLLEFGTNNAGWLKYFVDRLPQTYQFTGFDCFEGLPESWDGLPVGAIKGFGAPVQLWADDPVTRDKVIADAERGIPFPAPPQPNVTIESGLFSETLTRFLSKRTLTDLRFIHFDADLYISTRPVLDTLCGPLKHRYLILFDEFYSVNHEFRAWREFIALFKVQDWRVVAASADGSQVLIEVNTQSALQ
jgi:hypothetical protein